MTKPCLRRTIDIVEAPGTDATAVVFSVDDDLLTNAHVVGTTGSGRVVFADGTETWYDLTGVDPLSLRTRSV